MKSNILVLCLQDDHDTEDQLKKIQNEFLDIYSLYRKTGLSWIKEELLEKAYQLHSLDPSFTFQI